MIMSLRPVRRRRARPSPPPRKAVRDARRGLALGVDNDGAGRSSAVTSTARCVGPGACRPHRGERPATRGEWSRSGVDNDDVAVVPRPRAGCLFTFGRAPGAAASPATGGVTCAGGRRGLTRRRALTSRVHGSDRVQKKRNSHGYRLRRRALDHVHAKWDRPARSLRLHRARVVSADPEPVGSVSDRVRRIASRRRMPSLACASRRLRVRSNCLRGMASRRRAGAGRSPAKGPDDVAATVRAGRSRPIPELAVGCGKRRPRSRRGVADAPAANPCDERSAASEMRLDGPARTRCRARLPLEVDRFRVAREAAKCLTRPLCTPKVDVRRGLVRLRAPFGDTTADHRREACADAGLRFSVYVIRARRGRASLLVHRPRSYIETRLYKNSPVSGVQSR